jgi:hypothetical protein
MNRQFYEFWGDFFRQVSRGQKQLEEMFRWMHRGCTGVEALDALFRRCYGLSPAKPGDTENGDMWQKAVADFQRAFAQLADQWGWVSRMEHQRVLDRCASLEKLAAERKATIEELRSLLEEKGLGGSALFQHLNSALKEQSEQFHRLMDGIHETTKDRS